MRDLVPPIRAQVSRESNAGAAGKSKAIGQQPRAEAEDARAALAGSELIALTPWPCRPRSGRRGRDRRSGRLVTPLSLSIRLSLTLGLTTAPIVVVLARHCREHVEQHAADGLEHSAGELVSDRSAALSFFEENPSILARLAFHWLA